MREVNEKLQSSTDEAYEVVSEVSDPAPRKKNLDEMIEEFKKGSPVKNQKKSYRGVF